MDYSEMLFEAADVLFILKLSINSFIAGNVELT